MKNKNIKFLVLFVFAILGLFVFGFAETTGTQETNTGTTSLENILPQIMIDTGTNTIYISGYVGTGNNTGNNELIEETEDEEEDFDISELLEYQHSSQIDPEVEFENALSWMYSNGLTMYDDKEDYRMYDLLTREEASKIIGQAYLTLGYSDTNKNSNCDFSDSKLFDTTLSSHISNVCKWGLFQGADGKFMPHDNLTKAQAMAVLLRMFEGKMSYEQQMPWRKRYYEKGRLIGLTNIDNINDFDTQLTRREMALIIYRLKNIVENDQLRMMALNAIGRIVPENNTGIMDSNTVIENLNTLVGGINPYKDPELLEAIYWMFDNGLTLYSSANEYKPFETLNRAGGAKIFDIFSNMMGLTSESYLSNECNFSDIGKLDVATQEHIVNACKKGIIKGSNNLFSPDTNMNKSHFVVSLIRMFQGKHLDENVSPWWQNYFNEAQELGIVSPSDAITFDTPISRYEVALFLYKFDTKYKMLTNLNNARISNEIISTVPGSIITGTDGKENANVYVDSNLLKKGIFDLGYIEIFGNRYKIVKTSEKSYFSDNFVWYGDVFDLATDEKVGTISFIVSNGYLIESRIRLNGTENYQIKALSDTSAYYLIKRL